MGPTRMNKTRVSKRKFRKLSKTFDIAVPATLVFLGSCEVAFAYIDPGSASVIITAVLGFIGAFAYSFRMGFYNLKQRLFGKDLTDDREQEAPQEDTQAETREE